MSLSTLTRQRLTWLPDAATVAWASSVHLLVAPPLRCLPRISHNTGASGLCVTALAVSIISRGSVSTRVTARAGRPLAFRLGLLGLLSGVSELALAPAYLLSLAPVWLAWFGGAAVFATTTHILSQINGWDGAAAITEANAGAAWTAASPLVLGAVLAAGLAGGGIRCVCSSSG